MEYLIGLVLSLVVAGFAAIAGFDRDRAFYPTVLISTECRTGGQCRTRTCDLLLVRVGFTMNQQLATEYHRG